jgi:arginase family enzyme
MSVTICNFSNVYGNQPYLEGLKLSGKATWINLSDTSGTDCYCDDEAVAAINGELNKAGVVDAQGIHFIDNGNYHYMSKLWTDKIAESFTLVVFDHHPDMQEPRFGNILSCGGWVKKVLDENKFIDNVVIIGVADHLVDEIQPNDKVTFIRESKVYQIPGLARNDDIADIVQTSWRPTSRHLEQTPLYISIDKDALSPTDAATNWDQGSLSLEHMKAIIDALAQEHKIIGVDICGERAQDFSGDEHHTLQEADTLNDRTNQELVEFLEKFF